MICICCKDFFLNDVKMFKKCFFFLLVSLFNIVELMIESWFFKSLFLVKRLWILFVKILIKCCRFCFVCFSWLIFCMMLELLVVLCLKRFRIWLICWLWLVKCWIMVVVVELFIIWGFMSEFLIGMVSV